MKIYEKEFTKCEYEVRGRFNRLMCEEGVQHIIGNQIDKNFRLNNILSNYIEQKGIKAIIARHLEHFKLKVTVELIEADDNEDL